MLNFKAEVFTFYFIQHENLVMIQEKISIPLITKRKVVGLRIWFYISLGHDQLRFCRLLNCNFFVFLANNLFTKFMSNWHLFYRENIKCTIFVQRGCMMHHDSRGRCVFIFTCIMFNA